jgi:hypothetical protein
MLAGPSPALVNLSLEQILANATWGPNLLGGTITATGFNIGSFQRNCRAGLDWVENSLLNAGVRVEFGATN